MDIPWIKEETYTMEELMELAAAATVEGHYDLAQNYLERGAFSNDPIAKYALACLYRSAPELSLPQAARFARCEKLLLELENTFSKPKYLEPICQELAELYQDLRRPYSFVGYTLRAYNMLREPDAEQLAKIVHCIGKLDLRHPDTDPRGVGVLGTECLRVPSLRKKGVYFLTEAIEHGDKNGRLALLLAEQLEDDPTLDEDAAILSQYYRDIAAQRGYPDILVRTHA